MGCVTGAIMRDIIERNADMWIKCQKQMSFRTMILSCLRLADLLEYRRAAFTRAGNDFGSVDILEAFRRQTALEQLQA